MGPAGLLALVGCKKVDAHAAFGGIAGHAPAIRDVRDGTKGFVDFLQHVQNRGRGVLDSHRDILELGNVDVAGLE